MASKKVLDIGNCGPDHSAIRGLLESEFGVEVLQAHQFEDAKSILESTAVDLILVNRKLDIDYSDGIEVIRSLRNLSASASTPCMLITNYEEHQEAAMAIGALRGFGKLALRTPETKQILRDALASHSVTDS